MITRLEDSATTAHHWNGRDDINQNYSGRISKQPYITITLTWKGWKNARSYPVGKYGLDLQALLEKNLVRKKDGWYILRFQRTGNTIEIARKRYNAESIKLDNLPPEYDGPVL